MWKHGFWPTGVHIFKMLFHKSFSYLFFHRKLASTSHNDSTPITIGTTITTISFLWVFTFDWRKTWVKGTLWRKNKTENIYYTVNLSKQGILRVLLSCNSIARGKKFVSTAESCAFYLCSLVSPHTGKLTEWVIGLIVRNIMRKTVNACIDIVKDNR